jgi:hypothetical protein
MSIIFTNNLKEPSKAFLKKQANFNRRVIIFAVLAIAYVVVTDKKLNHLASEVRELRRKGA